MVAPSRMIIQADASRFGILEKAELRHWILVGRLGYCRGLVFSHLYPFPQLVGSLYHELSVARRHSGQTNILFADEHVGSETLRQLLHPSVEN